MKQKREQNIRRIVVHISWTLLGGEFNLHTHMCQTTQKPEGKKGPQVLEILKTTHKELFHAQTSLDEISQVSCKYILGLEDSYLLDWMWHMLIKQLVIVGRNLLTFARPTDRHILQSAETISATIERRTAANMGFLLSPEDIFSFVVCVNLTHMTKRYLGKLK